MNSEFKRMMQLAGLTEIKIKGIKLRSVEVFEHAGNSAIYEGL